MKKEFRKNHLIFASVIALFLGCGALNGPALAAGPSGVHGIWKVHVGAGDKVWIFAPAGDLFGDPDDCSGNGSGYVDSAAFVPVSSDPAEARAEADRVVSLATTAMAAGLKFETWFPGCSGVRPYFNELTVRSN